MKDKNIKKQNHGKQKIKMKQKRVDRSKKK